MKTFAAALLLVALPAWAADDPTVAPVAQALAKAASTHSPVLVDFHAPWCYSCYYMKTNVLTGPEWQAVEKRAVVLELDADSPEGSRWKDEWRVKALPSYIVLNEKGQELGRILAEQTRAEFYPQLNAILDKGSPMETLKAKAATGQAAAASEVLAAYHARREADAGKTWFNALPAAVRQSLAQAGSIALWLDRLDLQSAAAADDAASCIQSGAKVLAADLGCERAYELDTLMSCAEKLPAPQRSSVLKAQRPAMDQLVQQHVFGEGAACADERSVVFAAADLYEGLGDTAARQSVLDRAIAKTETRIGGNLTRDRNLSDNLRVFLDAAGHTEALDALLLQLIAAYPDDYVYAYRHGKNLLARGRPVEALPFLEQSSLKAYGINRLKVAELQVQALQALERPADARKVVAAALKANGPWFPDEAAKLKSMVKPS